MTDLTTSFFGGQFPSDPRIALKRNVPVPPRKTGPLHRVEYVVEFVGPKSIPAIAAARILDFDWYSALDQPKIWAMRSSDPNWERLSGSRDGSYDSLAISWPLVNQNNLLPAPRATELLQIANQFGAAIERHAYPRPLPEDVPVIAQDLYTIRESLDAGVSLVFDPSRPTVSEEDLWRACAALGLQMTPDGAFAWIAEGADEPLFEVRPVGITDRFTLAAVQRGQVHDGATIGFSIPRCPNPAKAVEGALTAARYFCETIGGRVLDDSDRFVDRTVASDIITTVTTVLATFKEAQLEPGSEEARRLFAATA